MTNKEAYKAITEKIIEQLEKGVIPWQKPWTTVNGGRTLLRGGSRDRAVSYVSGHPYSFLNQMMLGMRAGEYITFNQAKKLGVKMEGKKSQGTIYFWKIISKTEKVKVMVDGVEKTKELTSNFPMMRSTPVFNIDDLGLEPKWRNADVKDVKMPYSSTNPIKNAEDAVATYLSNNKGLTFVHNETDRAYFRPSADLVNVPNIQQFRLAEEYYSTAFHEFTHSTMLENRCNRPEGSFGGFGSKTYSKEELVAEMGTAFILHTLGIDTKETFKNSTAYIQSWISVLNNDHKAIVVAAKEAEKAANYILYNELPKKYE